MTYIDSYSLSISPIPIELSTFFLFIFLVGYISPPIFLQSPLMVLEMEKPRVTEIKVRMDCNGCVQKIKKALHGVNGIHDIYVDFPEQKITVTGWAEPEKLVKAIRKTRKSAVVCIHTEKSDEAEQPPPEGETTLEEGAPSAEAPQEPTNPRAEPMQTEAAPPAEGPDEPPEPGNPPPATSQHHQPPRKQDLEGVRIVYHHPPDHGYQYPYGPNPQQGYSRQWNTYHGGPGFRVEPYQPPQPVYVQSYNSYRPAPHVTEYAYPQSPPSYSFNSRPDHYNGPGIRGEPQQPPPPVYANHSYNTYKPSPYVTGYANPQSPPRQSPHSRPDNYSGPGFRCEPSQPPQPTHNYNMYKPSSYMSEYAYPESPPRYSSYSIPNNYSQDYNRGNYENGNVTSMFSEENPNACRIV